MSKIKFLRQDAHRFKRLGMKWRKPKGLQSKLKRKIKGAGNYPSSGHRSPKATRNLHPSGKPEVLVCNISELKKLDDSIVIRVSSTVGLKKRKEIESEAQKMKIRILNPKRVVEKKNIEKEVNESKKIKAEKVGKKVESKPAEKKEKLKSAEEKPKIEKGEKKVEEKQSKDEKKERVEEKEGEIK